MNAKDYRRQIESQLASGARAVSAAAAPAPTAGPEQGWSAAISTLADPKADTAARMAALRHLQGATFLGEHFASYRPDYLEALRKAATDQTAGRDGLRRAALDVLVNFKDEFARQKLVEGLRDIGKALVPAAAALGFLARDDHGASSDLARETLAKSSDAHTRAQAVRLLGADSSAVNDLLDILKNKDEFREVRRASAVALKALNEQTFAINALQIMNDATDFNDIRATVRGALERKGVVTGTSSSGTTE